MVQSSLILITLQARKALELMAEVCLVDGHLHLEHALSPLSHSGWSFRLVFS